MRPLVSGSVVATKSMITRLDHVMIAVRDLDDAIRRYRALGFDARRGGRHPGRGTENAVMRFAWEYLELIAVHDPVERAGLGRQGEGLTEFLAIREGGLVDPVFSTDALDHLAERFTRAGVTLAGPLALQRVRPDGVVVANRVLQPGGLMSSRQLYPGFIQWEVQDPERLTGEWAGAHAIGARGVAGLSTIVEDIERAKEVYAGVLGLSVEGEDLVPELGARRLRYRVDGLTFDLLAPTGPGRVQSELAEVGEGPFEVRLRVKDLARSRALLADAGASPHPAPGVPGGWLLPEESTVGARLVLVE